MEELQKYLFDLNGYLIIEDVLSTDDLATLNEIFARQEYPADSSIFAYAGGSQTGPGFLAWGEPYVDLLGHPAIMPALRYRLGDCFRLDRLYSIVMNKGMPKGKMHSDYGASSPIAKSIAGEYYPFPLNEIHSGFVVASWNLTDSGPGLGGFCCIPGSHKSNYKLPQQILDSSETSESAETFPHIIIPRRAVFMPVFLRVWNESSDRFTPGMTTGFPDLMMPQPLSGVDEASMQFGDRLRPPQPEDLLESL